MGWHGPPRSGKTLGMAAAVGWYLRRGRTGFSNFECFNCKVITPYEFLYFLKLGAEHAENSPLFNAVFAGQEFQTWLESRLGVGKAAVALTDVVCQAPKLGIKLLYDCQLPSSVDKRLKQNANVRFECEKTKKGFRYWDLDLSFTEECVRTGKKKFISLEYAKKYVMPFYNTRKVSLRPDFNDTLMSLERQDPRRKLATVEHQAALLMKNRGLWLDTNTTSIKYALLKLGQSEVFADYVAAALKVQAGTRR